MRIDAIATGPLAMPVPEKKDVGKTASEFEALMIGQLLRSARPASGGWFGSGEDQSSASLIEMGEDQLAKVLADGGGLGLGQAIEKAMSAQNAAAGTTVEAPAKDQEGSSTVQMSGKLR